MKEPFPEQLSTQIIFEHKENLFRLVRAIRHSGVNLDIRQLPLSYLADNKTDIVVHPNMVLDLRKSLDVENAISPSNFRSRRSYVLNSLRSTFESETQDERKKLRWNKVDAVLARKETTTIARYLKNHLQLSEHGLRDDQIRDLAQKVEHFFKPPGLILCNSPDDYVKMFRTGVSSCMAPTSSYFGPITHELNKLGFYPSIWFLYNPQTQGVFIEKEGKPMARGFLIRTNKDQDFKEYANVMGVTTAFGQQLTKLLEQAGYKPAKMPQIPIKYHFEVPSIEHKGKKYCPLPFHDVITHQSYYAAYDTEKDVFRFGPNNEAPNMKKLKKNVAAYSHKGYVCESEL